MTLLSLVATAFIGNSSVDPPTAAELAQMSRCQLEEVYRGLSAPAFLDCFHSGQAFRKHGDGVSRPASWIWKGKVFDGCGTMVNRWCLGLEAVPARVRVGPSWLDGNPALILDYRGRSRLIWRHARDEVRQVAPGLYLGIMFVDKGREPKLVRFFILESECAR